MRMKAKTAFVSFANSRARTQICALAARVNLRRMKF